MLQLVLHPGGACGRDGAGKDRESSAVVCSLIAKLFLRAGVSMSALLG